MHMYGKKDSASGSPVQIGDLNRAVHEIFGVFENESSYNIALIGGLAVQEHYSPRRIRPTSDIDIVCDEYAFSEIMQHLEKNGCKGSQGPVSNLYCAKLSQNAPVNSNAVINAPIDVDIFAGNINGFPLDGAFFSNCRHVAGTGIRLASPEDLLVMKAEAHLERDNRGLKDLLDISAILISDTNIDSEYLDMRIRNVSSRSNISASNVYETITNVSSNVCAQLSNREKRKALSRAHWLKREFGFE